LSFPKLSFIASSLSFVLGHFSSLYSLSNSSPETCHLREADDLVEKFPEVDPFSKALHDIYGKIIETIRNEKGYIYP